MLSQILFMPSLKPLESLLSDVVLLRPVCCAGLSLQLESEASGEDRAEHGIVLAEKSAAEVQFVSVKS
jgi:hypothetical protein